MTMYVRNTLDVYIARSLRLATKLYIRAFIADIQFSSFRTLSVNLNVINAIDLFMFYANGRKFLGSD